MTASAKQRYLVVHAKGDKIASYDLQPLQIVLDDCPKGYKLHSFQSFNSGDGFTLYWKVVFERDFT